MNPQSIEELKGTKVTPSTTRPTGSGGSKFLSYLIAALCLAGFAGLVFWKIQSRIRVQAEISPAEVDANRIPVQIVHPQHSAANQDLTIPGNVQAYVETPIYARTDGYLKKWYVDIGGRVKAGELLATIDSPEVDEQLHQAEAALLQAQANLELAKSTAARYQALLESGSVAQQDVDQSASAYKAGQANLNAANANVERLKDLQSFEQVTAPFSGVITTRNVDPGALISSGSGSSAVQLFRLAQIDVLRVYVNVPEGYGPDMQPGVPAQLQIAEFPNRTFTGKVARNAGAIDPSSRTLLTEVQVENPKGELMPGSYAQVTFHLSSGSQPLVIPANALLFRSAGPEVAVVDANKAARLQKILVGRDFGTSLEIISGLKPEDSVIVNPPDSISDGIPVTVEEPAKVIQPGQPAAPANH
jgi:RND family efflux transporter MFP subunit